jgi:hypothetical protein
MPFDPTSKQARVNKAVLELWARSDLPLMTVFSDPADPAVARPANLPPDQDVSARIHRQSQGHWTLTVKDFHAYHSPPI